MVKRRARSELEGATPFPTQAGSESHQFPLPECQARIARLQSREAEEGGGSVARLLAREWATLVSEYAAIQGSIVVMNGCEHTKRRV